MADERERVLCSFCGEEIAAFARKCWHCGEYLDPTLRKDGLGLGTGVALALVVGLVLVAMLCAVGAVVAAVLVPSVLQARRRQSEEAAIEALRLLTEAEETFRRTDADQDGAQDYGDLSQLGMAGLLEPALASGIRDGYVFEVAVSESEPLGRWMATASPLAPGKTGERYFVTNHGGGVYYRTDRPVELELHACDVPPDTLPLGAGYEGHRRR